MKRRMVSALLVGVLLIGLACGAEGARGTDGAKGNGGGNMGAAKVQEVVQKEEITNKKPVYEGTYGEVRRAVAHDPSIIKEPDTGMYYVFGTHLAAAKSEDLVNWEQIGRDYENVADNPVYGNLEENFAESFQWAGSHDADCANGFAVWAPDVYWDDEYIWEDGSRGAYLMYYSASSTYIRSCIGLAASKTIEGPFEYKATLIYSGFTKENGTDANSEIDT